MPRELLEPGAEAPALADGVADAGATAEPESPPVVSAVDAGQGQPPTIGAVDPGSEPPPAIGAVDPGSEPPPVVVGAADAGADAG